MASIVSRIKSRLGRNGLSRTIKYIFFVVFLERCGVRVNNLFLLDPSSVCSEPPLLDGYTPAVTTRMDQLTDSDTAFCVNMAKKSRLNTVSRQGEPASLFEQKMVKSPEPTGTARWVRRRILGTA